MVSVQMLKNSSMDFCKDDKEKLADTSGALSAGESA